MSCTHWKDGWVAHLYDELDPAEERLLEQHLKGCEECCRRLDELSASRQVLRDACPEVPATPTVVVLKPRRFAGPGWAYAAGAACATLLFALGLMAGHRLPGAASPDRAALTPSESGAIPAMQVTEPAAVSPDLLQARLEPLLQRIDTLEANLAACDNGQPDGEWLTRAQFEDGLGRLERRADLKRARDFDYLLSELNATEARTGTYFNQTREALQMVAMRSDPRFTER